ncbi:hypothetical protein [Campylobacter sp. MG1]|uniref:hypothetical protein n=1 Tax=Campylobacter sp. MG1 TaxID=2976332 RepID=UPI00226C97D6|nr:hypothetical protein [Campylobacter sp. MG1]
MENPYVKIHKFIDIKPMVANWEFPSFAIFIVGVLIAGMYVPDLLYKLGLMVFSFYLASFHNSVKHKFVRGFLAHKLYAMGIKGVKQNIPFHQRYFIGA